MTNSEIIAMIIAKNKPQKVSEIEKVRILAYATAYGTAEDIQTVYDTYGAPEFESIPLSCAIDLADREKLKTLLDNGAEFTTTELRNDLKNKYCDDPWYYILAFIPEVSPRLEAVDFYPVEIHKKEMMKALPRPVASVEERVELVQLFYNRDTKALNKKYPKKWPLPRTPNCDLDITKLIAYAFLYNDCDFAQALIDRGFAEDSSIIRCINREFNLLDMLSQRTVEERRNIIRVLQNKVQNGRVLLHIKGPLKEYHEIIFDPPIFDVFLASDIDYYTHKEIIENAIESKDNELLQMLDEWDYFSNTPVRNRAMKYAESHGYTEAYQWLCDLTKKIEEEKKNTPKIAPKKCEDSENAKLFLHKGFVITGLSKEGISYYQAEPITEVTLPSVIDGKNIYSIEGDAITSFAELIPNVHTLILPKGIRIHGKFCPESKDPATSGNGIKKIVLYSEACIDYLSFSNFGGAITDIEIIDGSKYCTQDGIIYSKDKTKLVFYPRGKKNEKYVIPDTVEEICTDALSYCTIDTLVIQRAVTLQYRAIANSCIRCLKITADLKEIPQHAFANSCIRCLKITADLKEIPQHAFEECTILEEVDLPEGLEIIRYRAFQKCGAPVIELPESLRVIENDAFDESNAVLKFKKDDVDVGGTSNPSCIAYCRKQNIRRLQEITGKQIVVPDFLDHKTVKNLVKVAQLLKDNKGNFNSLTSISRSDYTLNADYALYLILIDDYETLCEVLSTVTKLGSYKLYDYAFLFGGKWMDVIYDKLIKVEEGGAYCLNYALMNSNEGLCHYLLDRGVNLNSKGVDLKSTIAGVLHFDRPDYKTICMRMLNGGIDLFSDGELNTFFAWRVFRDGNAELKKAYVDKLKCYGYLENQEIYETVKKYCGNGEIKKYLESVSNKEP